MADSSTSEYSLPICWLIALTPITLALVITYFSHPRGFIIDFRPFSWLVDYIVIWPVVWFSTEMLNAAKWIWWNTETGLNLHAALRLTGGFTLIYVCVWLIVVPVIGQAALNYSWLNILPPSYSQVLRFLVGILGSVTLRLFHDLYRARQAVG